VCGPLWIVILLMLNVNVDDDDCLQNFPWPQSVVEELIADNADSLNTSPCLILFTGEKRLCPYVSVIVS